MMKYLNESTKKMLMILLGVVVVFVVVLVGIFIYKGVTGSKVSYDRLKTITEASAKKYLEEKQLLPVTEGDMVTVGIDTLVSYDYMKPLTKLTNEENCTGKVTVTNNGGFYLYNTYVDCKDKETTTLNDVIKKNVVTVDAGLYKVNNEYYFKGEFVDNYVKFAGTTWRIIKIDEKGNLKLIKQEAEKQTSVWDNRYNATTNSGVGINDYTLSRMKEKLNSIYNDPKIFNDSDKKFIVPYEICIGTRGVKDISLDSTKDCAKKLNGQYVSLINANDYAIASLDKDCKSIISKSCKNYNYFANFFYEGWTLTASSDDNFQVYDEVGGTAYFQNASQKSAISLVIYIQGENAYHEGNGTKEFPYVIK